MRVGYLGLGNVGGKQASSLLRDGFVLMVNDLQRSAAGPLCEGGAKWEGGNTAEVARYSVVVITCQPYPRASAKALESADGVLTGRSASKIWLEMSSSDH